MPKETAPGPASRGRFPRWLSMQRGLGNQGVIGMVQPKLKIGEPDDQYEREADQVAQQVMGMPAPLPPPGDSSNSNSITLSNATVQRKCTACQREDDKWLQRKSTDVQPPSVSYSPPDSAAPSGGRALDSATRNFFEPRFGYDFSGVRVHTDGHAQSLNTRLGARAFTYGRDIAFAKGEYQPHSHQGRQLMAHELTHVVQQGRARRQGGTRSSAAIQRKLSEPVIQRACVANLIPLLRCCDYSGTLSHRRIGTIAHEQLEMGAALLNPGVLGEVGIPPALGISGWKSMDLFSAMPYTMPSQVGNPTAAMRPLVNPLGIPYATAPPLTAPAEAEVGEIKPLSAGGIAEGPVDLTEKLLQYNAWGIANGATNLLSGLPMQSGLPLIYGGPFLSAAFGNSQHIFMARVVPGLYNYFCIDPKRMRREIRAALRRLQQRVEEIIEQARQLLDRISDFLAEWWWLVLIILIVLIVIIVLIIIFTAPVSVPAIGGGAAVAGGTAVAGGATLAGGTAVTSTGVVLTVVEGGAATTAVVGGSAAVGEGLAAAAAIIFALLGGEYLLHPDGEPLGTEAATAEGDLAGVIPGGTVPPQAQSGGGPTLVALNTLDNQLAGLQGIMGTNPGGSFSAGPLLPAPETALAMIEDMTPTVASDPRFGGTATTLSNITSRGREAVRRHGTG